MRQARAETPCRDLGLSWNLREGRLPSLRLKVDGEFSISCGDVVVRRSDGFISYHLATVVDELILGISEVVRGMDLATSMHSQLAIIHALDQKPLHYRHVPLFLNDDGEKLSKRLGGVGLQGLKSKGMLASDVIGYLASTLDLVPQGSALSALELLSDLKKKKDWIKGLSIS